ncbi:FAD/NAD(P)-binding protein [Streptomyces sp. NPDC093018]|uniref:FAD/NAD(P)-binding protein n=1 Tax=Streptomyces sp. NPDC093018 TaxID=3155067 RepID=UPI00343B96E6
MEVCIVGAGPRGLCVLERIVARAVAEPRARSVTVHLVDPHPAGAGAVWRTDQAGCLLMNTVASQVTVFADETAGSDVPLLGGPSLYEWARRDPQEASRAPRPDDYPTRAQYGRYLRWVLGYLVERAPDEVTVRVHRDRAVRLREGPRGQAVHLSGGTTLGGLDAVVLSQGHLPVAPTAEETALGDHAARHGLCYVPPGNPADADLSKLGPGHRVLLRGLGLNFFDHMALLTVGRGGSFETGADGRLVYRASGREPLLFAGSRRGIPHQARGANEKGPSGVHEAVVLTPEVIASLRHRARRDGSLSFRRHVWPYIAKEVETAYYVGLVRNRGLDPAASEAFRGAVLAAPCGSAAERSVLDAYGIGEDARWDWEHLARPYLGRTFRSAEHYGEWAAGYLRQDAERAARGNLSDPVKKALDVLRDLRNQVRAIVDHAGVTGTSYRDELRRWFTPLNAFLSIGPPRSRTLEALALMEAGVLRLIGPRLRVEPEATGRGFLAWSPMVAGAPVRADALIEARLPEPDVRRTTDPLLRDLLARGEAASFRVPDPDGPGYDTGALAVTERPARLVDAAGRAHSRRFAFGVPTEGVHWVTAAGIRPGAGSVTVLDADAISRALFEQAVPVRMPVGVREAA